MKNSKLNIFMWALSILFVISGLATIPKSILCGISCIIFGLILNPKFTVICGKILKERKITKNQHIVLGIASFILIGATAGSINKEDTKEVMQYQDTTTIATTVTPRRTTTEATTTPIVTTTEKVTTTTPVTTTEVKTTIDETPYREVYAYFNDLLDDESNPENEILPNDLTDEDIKSYVERCEQYEIDCMNDTAEHFGITYDDVNNIWLYFASGGSNTIDLSEINPNNLKPDVTTTASTTTVSTTVTTTAPVTATTTKEVVQQNNNQSITVYITPTGEKYHYDNSCNGGTYNPSTLDVALSLGLEPCKKCIG